MQDRATGNNSNRVMLKGGTCVCVIAALLWLAAVVLVAVIDQQVSYRVCDGTILQLPPPSVHWPPQGQNLNLIPLQNTVTLIAVGTGIIGTFLVLYASPTMSVLQRTRLFLFSIAGSLAVWAFLWLIVHFHVVSAEVQALGSCF